MAFTSWSSQLQYQCYICNVAKEEQHDFTEKTTCFISGITFGLITFNILNSLLWSFLFFHQFWMIEALPFWSWCEAVLSLRVSVKLVEDETRQTNSVLLIGPVWSVIMLNNESHCLTWTYKMTSIMYIIVTGHFARK